MATDHIPDQYRDLLDRPIVVSLSTMMPDGQPQSTPVWCDYDGTFVRINSSDGRQKVENMEARPKATVLIIDPNNPYRWMEIRGEVEQITHEGAADHINKLSLEYRGNANYFENNPQKPEERVMFLIRPYKVNASG